MPKLAALVAAALLALPAAAQDASGRTRLGLRGGLFLPMHDDLDGFDDGIDLGATVGLRIAPHLWVEGGLGWYRTKTGPTFDPGSGLTLDVTLRVVPVTASLRLEGEAGALVFSGLAGLGLHAAKMTGKSDVPGVGPVEVSDSDNAFGFHLGAAAGVRVSPSLLLGAEVVRTFAQADLFDVKGNIDGLRVGATLTFAP